MKHLCVALVSLVAADGAQAHVSDQPLLQHALEHGWLLLLALPVVLALLSPGRERRR